MTLAGLVALGAAACGDDEPYCGAHQILRDQRSGLCMSAHEFAKRTTTAIIPTQAELEAAELLLRRGFEPLRPALARIPVAASWNQERTLVTWYVTDPAIAAAWSAGLAPTGDSTVDAVVAAMDVWDFDLTPTQPAGYHASFWSRGAVSAANIATAVAAVPGVTVEQFAGPAAGSSSDIIDEGVDPADGGHAMQFMVGWGDCPSGCWGSHYWRTKFYADGRARLVDEWGAPLPPGTREFLASEPDVF